MELNYWKDEDGDGDINALDSDSDGDGILDRTEWGLTEKDISWGTNLSKNNFTADMDPHTVTSMISTDTDGASCAWRFSSLPSRAGFGVKKWKWLEES